MLLAVMCGFDPKDSTSLQLDDENFAAAINQPFKGAPTNAPLSGLRVGMPKEFFADGLSAEVRSAVEQALTEFKRLGATLCEVSLPRTALSIPAYYVIAPAEASSNLSRFDGVRYGHRATAPSDLLDLYCRSRAEGFGAEVKRRILIGTFVLSHGYYDAYYIQAQRVRRLVAQDFDTAFQGCDLIAGPVAPTVAWDIDQAASDPLREYLADIYTLGVNLAGLPALSMPVGFGSGAGRPRPIGMQLIAPRLNESLLLRAAHHFQSATDWHQKRPSTLERHDELGDCDWPGMSCAAKDRIKDILTRIYPVRRRSEYAGPYDRLGAARRFAGHESRGGRLRDTVWACGGWTNRAPIHLCKKELFLS